MSKITAHADQTGHVVITIETDVASFAVRLDATTAEDLESEFVSAVTEACAISSQMKQRARK